MPYISTTPARLKNPCAGNQNCTSPFSYKNVLKLTSNGDEFNQLVSQQQISGNLDSPEGGFDAIMQVAVCEVRGSEVEVCLRTTPPHPVCDVQSEVFRLCVLSFQEHIGWRNVTRLLVFSTDAGFHFAGDGKLGGIVLPNDGKCHLQNNMYTMSHYYVRGSHRFSTGHVHETETVNIRVVLVLMCSDVLSRSGLSLHRSSGPEAE